MRNRIIRYTLAIALALVVSSPARPVGVSAPQQAGRLKQVGGILFVHLQGDPYQMGLQQGALLRTQLHSLVQDYLYRYLIADSGASHFWLLSQARLLDRELPESLRQEMAGIANGSGLSYQDVLLLNVVPDLLFLARKAPSWDLFPMLFSSANRATPLAWSSLGTAFAGWGRATVGGELLIGHQLDCAESALLQHYLVLIVRQPSAGNALVSLGLAGTVGVWTGMSEQRVIVALSSSPSADVAGHGQPLPLLLRQVLQNSGDLGQAVNLLLSTERLYGGNVILGDGKTPQGIVLELSAHRHALFEMNVADDLLLRTNHFLDTELALAQRLVLSPEEVAASEMRLKRLQDMLEPNRGWIGAEKALAILGNPDRVPVSGSEGGGTLQTVLLNAGQLTLWIAENNPGAATATSYSRLDLAAELLESH